MVEFHETLVQACSSAEQSANKLMSQKLGEKRNELPSEFMAFLIPI